MVLRSFCIFGCLRICRINPFKQCSAPLTPPVRDWCVGTCWPLFQVQAPSIVEISFSAVKPSQGSPPSKLLCPRQKTNVCKSEPATLWAKELKMPQWSKPCLINPYEWFMFHSWHLHSYINARWKNLRKAPKPLGMDAWKCWWQCRVYVLEQKAAG